MLSGIGLRRGLRGERGTVMVFALGGLLLALLVALVLADTSSLFMRRSALLMVADDAAIAAAGAVDLAAIYEQGVGDGLTVDPQLAWARADASVAAASDDRLVDIRLDGVLVANGEVEVRVSAAVPAPLGGITGDRMTRIRARATASTPTRW